MPATTPLPPATAQGHTHPPAARQVRTWTRYGAVLLVVLAHLLTFDPLQQVAVALNFSGPVSYAFPFLVDGFIALAVRLALLLRNAPSHVRLYAWALVALAVAVRFGATAVHAIQLNQQPPAGAMHFNDLVTVIVGAGVSLTPLAAVHLLLVVSRHSAGGRA
ncbi:DUF2637 domain-containing protein [Streptomyces sp. T-3]|nr:DUF2637 domain-containing protein [Streptomyces sp. T-3]